MKRKMETKKNKDLKKILIISVITILLVIGIFSVHYYLNSKAEKEQREQEEYSVWLAENCNCLERNYFFCEDGFEYDGTYCVKDNSFTLVRKKCSKYDCDGEINILNLETLKWQKEN